MTHSFDGYNHLVRLEMGERLSEALERFAAEAKVEGAWLSGLGAAGNVVLGFYNLGPKTFKWRTIAQTMEVVSLSGNLAIDETGKVTYHLHGVFADDEYHTVGGHVQDLVVASTLELFVHRSYQPMRRQHDDEIGLPLLSMG